MKKSCRTFLNLALLYILQKTVCKNKFPNFLNLFFATFGSYVDFSDFLHIFLLWTSFYGFSHHMIRDRQWSFKGCTKGLWKKNVFMKKNFLQDFDIDTQNRCWTFRIRAYFRSETMKNFVKMVRKVNRSKTRFFRKNHIFLWKKIF